MSERYSHERIRARLISFGKVMISDDDNVMALRAHIYILRKQGFVIKRIGKIGSIKGYELVEKPNDRQ